MDPNANLEELLERAQTIVQTVDNAPADEDLDPFSESCVRVCELVNALDGWLRQGGFLPEAWATQDALQGAALMRLIEQRGAPKVVRKNGTNDWMMAGYVLVIFEDGFECGIAPDGSVSS